MILVLDISDELMVQLRELAAAQPLRFDNTRITAEMLAVQIIEDKIMAPQETER